MAPVPATPGATGGPTSLAGVRARIDAVDADLVHLLAERQSLVRAAAAFKVDEQAVRAPDRVERVVAAVRERAAAAGLSPAVAESVWRAMIAAFIELELVQHATTAGTTGPQPPRQPEPAVPSDRPDGPGSAQDGEPGGRERPRRGQRSTGRP